MAKLVADHPDTFSCNLDSTVRHIKPGDVMPAAYVGIWQTLANNNIPVRAGPALAGQDSRSSLRTAWPKGNHSRVRSRGPRCWSIGVQPSTSLRFPLLKPLDMSDAICGPTPAARSSIFWCTATKSPDPHHMRTLTSELGRQIAANTDWW